MSERSRSWLLVLRGTSAAALLACAAAAPSCAENESSIFIRQFQALVAPECASKADVSAITIQSGLIDLAIRSDYKVYPLIGNQLQRLANQAQSKSEGNHVQIEGAEIVLKGPNIDKNFSVVATAFIDAAVGTDPSYAVSAVDLIPSELAPGLRAKVLASGTFTLVASVRVFGKTLAGRAVESGEVAFPITVCYGCKVSFPKPDDTTGKVSCAPKESATIEVCRPGQDSTTPCSACRGVPVCTPCETPDDCTKAGFDGLDCVAGHCDG